METTEERIEKAEREFTIKRLRAAARNKFSKLLVNIRIEIKDIFDASCAGFTQLREDEQRDGNLEEVAAMIFPRLVLLTMLGVAAFRDSMSVAVLVGVVGTLYTPIIYLIGFIISLYAEVTARIGVMLRHFESRIRRPFRKD